MIRTATNTDAVKLRAGMVITSGTLYPTLRANPYPEVTDLFCRLPLPAFVYRLEATHLGDLMRFWVRPGARAILSPGFSWADMNAPGGTRGYRSSRHNAISPDDPIPWSLELLNRKENSPQGSHRRPRVLMRCREYSASRYGNINPFPFRWIAFYTLSHGITPSLRIDSPMSKRCSHGTLLHSSPQGSRLNLCYFHQDLHSSPFHLNSHLRLLHKLDALLLTGTEALSRRRCIGHTLKRHPFSGPMRSAGELLHTP